MEVLLYNARQIVYIFLIWTKVTYENDNTASTNVKSIQWVLVLVPYCFIADFENVQISSRSNHFYIEYTHNYF